MTGRNATLREASRRSGKPLLWASTAMEATLRAVDVLATTATQNDTSRRGQRTTPIQTRLVLAMINGLAADWRVMVP